MDAPPVLPALLVICAARLVSDWVEYLSWERRMKLPFLDVRASYNVPTPYTPGFRNATGTRPGY